MKVKTKYVLVLSVNSKQRANDLSVKNKQTNVRYDLFIAIEYGKTLALFFKRFEFSFKC